jgi:[acyl-carrier-protein] S-malonyltransferase
MADAAAAFAKQLNSIPFNDSQVPLLSNSDPRPSSDAVQLKQRLTQQMTTGVRWRETMQALAAAGVTTVVEVGPGAVLSGLCKRSLEGVTTAQIQNPAHLGLS